MKNRAVFLVPRLYTDRVSTYTYKVLSGRDTSGYFANREFQCRCVYVRTMLGIYDAVNYALLSIDKIIAKLVARGLIFPAASVSFVRVVVAR